MIQSPMKAAADRRSMVLADDPEVISVVKQRLEKGTKASHGDTGATSSTSRDADPSTSWVSWQQIASGSSASTQAALVSSPLLPDAIPPVVPTPSVLKLVLRNPGSSASTKTVENDNVVEVYDENESGLSWGRRKAKDNSWEEQWLQQAQEGVVATEAETVADGELLREDIVFGRSSGVNSSLRQRWTATWENRLRRDGVYKKTVKKVCQRYEADMKTVVEEWTEYIVETSTNNADGTSSVISANENTVPLLLPDTTGVPKEDCSVVSDIKPRDFPGRAAKPSVEAAAVGRVVRIVKFGTDYLSGRLWRSEKVETFDSQGTTRMLDDHFEERFKEASGDGIAAEESSGRQICRSKHRHMSDSTDVDQRDEVEQQDGVVYRAAFERIERIPGNDSVGFQRSYVRGKRTVERRWTERPDGSRETADCTLVGKLITGRKSHKNANGMEVYGCRWEQEIVGNEEHDESLERGTVPGKSHQVRRLWDEWWTDAETKHRWGTKVAQVVSGPPEKLQREASSLVTGHGNDAPLSPFAAVTPALLEPAETLLHGSRDAKLALPSATFVKEDHEKWYDHDAEEISNDKWTVCTTYELPKESSSTSVESSVSEKAIIKKLVESGSKIVTRPSEGTEQGEQWFRRSEQSAQEPSEQLVLETTHSDKWWKEPSGNKWGEKKTVNWLNNSEQNEKWYNNGTEEVTDRWEIKADGTKEGFKRGRKLDNSELWQEKWGGNPEAEDSPDANYWIDKFWEKHDLDGATYKWGTVNGREDGREWNESWRETAGSTGEKYVEKWNTDGCGNSQTTKEGTSWRNDQVTNWFSDKYGSCESHQETWAFKQGNNPVTGDTWVEKWNEFPNRKVAEKSGRNSQGDEWNETWSQEWVGETLLKLAQKAGRNGEGCEWREEWREEGDSKKSARKSGSTPHEEWTEEWSEDFSAADGSGCKWTNKWASNRADGKTTNSHGQSWGERWNEYSSHLWGDEWETDESGNKIKGHKWNYEKPGKRTDNH